MTEFGVSFSIKQCQNFGIPWRDTLTWLIEDCGFKRFRLMSYWNLHETSPGVFDFELLDKQIELVAKHKGTVSLCIGARQPRWPENHWPDWAWQLSYEERSKALLAYIEIVVKRYKKYKCIVSYQLENEALLKEFGERSEVNRQRLRQEYALVKQLDNTRPIIMTTSTSWGIPLRRPIPDIIGFSYYQVIYNAKKQAYSTAFHKPWLHRLRALAIKLIWRRPSFIHELQLEPWGPKNIWEMTEKEQAKSMSPKQMEKNIELAKKTNLKTIDLWGGEWWYWQYKQDKDSEVTQIVKGIGHQLHRQRV